MIQVRVQRGLADGKHADLDDGPDVWVAHREREKVLEEILADHSLHVRCARGEPDPTWGGARDRKRSRASVELVLASDQRLERALVRLVELLAEAVRERRIADFDVSLPDGTTIACPRGRAIEVSWPSIRSGELASHLAEQLGCGVLGSR
jgi:hypothetical protein